MAQRVTLAIPNPADSSQDVNVGAATPLPVSLSGSGATAQQVQGNVASDATDAGNPVTVAGVVNNGTPTAATNGQRKSLWMGISGAAVVAAVTTSGADATSNSIRGLPSNASGSGAPLMVANYVLNGSTWDRQRGDTTGTFSVSVPSTTAAVGITAAATAVAGSSQVIKASAGNLYGVNVVAGASAGYLMLFNAISAPADGVVTPIKCVPVAANAGLTISFNPPIRFGTGITAVFSTTGPFTKTASATAFISGDAA